MKIDGTSDTATKEQSYNEEINKTLEQKIQQEEADSGI